MARKINPVTIYRYFYNQSVKSWRHLKLQNLASSKLKVKSLKLKEDWIFKYYPEEFELKEADKVLKHEFEILGKTYQFGQKINWHTSEDKQQDWPKLYYEDLNDKIYRNDFQNQNFLGDLKIPWDLSKHLYFQNLARAYFKTKNEKYSLEFWAEIEDWIKDNPAPYGVNWSNCLPVSQRIVSWCMVLPIFLSSPSKPANLQPIFDSLYQHGIYIRSNLEFAERNTNHLVGNLASLIVLGSVFPEIDKDRKWLNYAKNQLENEVLNQVYPDGVHYEQSIAYARLVFELFLVSWAALKSFKMSLDSEVENRIKKLATFLEKIQMAGELPAISDHDGAKVFLLTKNINNFKPLWELASSIINQKIPMISGSHAFGKGGYFISEDKDKKLIFDCGYIGTNVWPNGQNTGSHGHSDTLNILLAHKNQPVLVDSGMFVYSDNKKWHDHFRASVAHNVTLLNSEDQNVLTQTWKMQQFARPENVKFKFMSQFDYLSGEHTGYQRLSNPWQTKREIVSFKNRNLIIVKDSFLGKGKGDYETLWHFDPKAKVTKIKDGVQIKIGDSLLKIVSLKKVQAEIKSSWYSPCYGKKIQSSKAVFKGKVENETSLYYAILPSRVDVDAQEFKNMFIQARHKALGTKIVMMVANNFTHDARVLKEALSAKSAGFDVTVLARKSKDTSFTEEYKDIKIIRVQTFLDKIWTKMSKSGGQEVAGSQSAGAPKSLVIYAAILNTWLMNRLFVKEVMKIDPNIVHANDSTSLQAGYCFGAQGIKVIYDAHELYTEQLEKPHPIWKWYFTSLEKKLKVVDGIFSVNQSILDELSKRYGVGKIPQAILYNTPSFVKTKPQKNKKIKLLYLGHYMPGRGLEQVIEAVNKMENVTLSLYGKGFNFSSTDKIKVMTPVKPDKVVLEASKYDIGILPYIGNNLNNLYSTPNKLFEYLMGGLAIAASKLPEISKIIKKTDAGVLFNPEEPESLVESLNFLIKHPYVLNRCRKNALKAAKEYCWENQAVKQIEMYDRLIK